MTDQKKIFNLSQKEPAMVTVDALWDSMTPQQRRRRFGGKGNLPMFFASWVELTQQEQRLVRSWYEMTSPSRLIDLLAGR